MSVERIILISLLIYGALAFYIEVKNTTETPIVKSENALNGYEVNKSSEEVKVAEEATISLPNVTMVVNRFENEEEVSLCKF